MSTPAGPLRSQPAISPPSPSSTMGEGNDRFERAGPPTNVPPASHSRFPPPSSLCAIMTLEEPKDWNQAQNAPPVSSATIPPPSAIEWSLSTTPPGLQDPAPM